MTNFLVSQGAVRNGWFLDAAAIVAQSDTAAVAYEKVHPDPPRITIYGHITLDSTPQGGTPASGSTQGEPNHGPFPATTPSFRPPLVVPPALACVLPSRVTREWRVT